MKTVTLPGTTVRIGAKLTMTPAGKQSGTVALTSPVSLVAYGGGDWSTDISTSKKIIALALLWEEGVTIKSAGEVTWALSDPDGLNCTLSEASSSTSAGLSTNTYGLGTVTVTATVDGLTLTATITFTGE